MVKFLFEYKNSSSDCLEAYKIQTPLTDFSIINVLNFYINIEVNWFGYEPIKSLLERI